MAGCISSSTFHHDLGSERVFCTIKDDFSFARNEDALGLSGTPPPGFHFSTEAKASLGKRFVECCRMLLKPQPGLDNLPIHLRGSTSMKKTGLFSDKNVGFHRKTKFIVKLFRNPFCHQQVSHPSGLRLSCSCWWEQASSGDVVVLR